MWETLSENEKIWITMNEDNSQITIHFKVRTTPKMASDIDEDYWIELPYSTWRTLITVARKTRECFEPNIGTDVRENDICAQWLSRDCVELDIGQYFRRYFNSETYLKFAVLIEQAAEKIVAV